MVYLFDDTSDNFIRGYINPLEYTDILSVHRQLGSADLEAMAQALSSADCILMHKSMRDNEDTSSENKVLKTVSSEISAFGKKVPLVLFSDGDLEAPVFYGKSCIRAIKKTRFYSNLAPFLKYVREHGPEVNLNILAYGDNMSEAVVAKGQALLSDITFLDSDAALSLEDVSEDNLVELVSMSAPGIGKDSDDLIADIEDGMVTVRQMRDNIKAIMESFIEYGENLHTWR